jgi:hypothetical protein
MITRAYQNADNERQEITLSADQWEALTEGDLQNLLGFNKPAPKPEPKAESFKPVAVRRKYK